MAVVLWWLVAVGLVFSARAGGVVTTCSEPAVRQALAGGGLVVFQCDGSIPLANPLLIAEDTVLDASGRSVELSGNHAVRVLQVRAGVQLTLKHLKVAQGRSDRGAGILNEGGSVWAQDCSFVGNQAVGADGFGPGVVPGPGASAWGGAVFSEGVLVLERCTVVTNLARGGRGASFVDDSRPSGFAGGWATAGAIYNKSQLVLIDCVFEGNEASAGAGGDGRTDAVIPGSGGGGGFAEGGAVASTGTLQLNRCAFLGNGAVGGWGGAGYYGSQGGDARGGAVRHAGGEVRSLQCSFLSNQAVAGRLGGFPRTVRHGLVHGGALSLGTSTVSFISSVIVSNTTLGEASRGGGIAQDGGRLTVTKSVLEGNRALGYVATTYYGRSVSPSEGGGIFSSGPMFVSECTISSNQVAGGDSGGGYSPQAGGLGVGGGLCGRNTVQIHRTTLAGNNAWGGAAAIPFWPGEVPGGGPAQGGGLACLGSGAMVENCAVAGNLATGGPGNDLVASPGGDAYGGGVYLAQGTNVIQHATLAGNGAYGGGGAGPQGQAYGGGFHTSAGFHTVQNSIVAQSVSGADTSGVYTGDHNLISVEPHLDVLAFNGGATWTLALLPGSPAIDAGFALPGLLTDQRGCARPFGLEPDIGAFEWNSPLYTNFFLHSVYPVIGGWRVVGTGPSTEAFRLEASSNFSDWAVTATVTARVSGWFDITDTQATGWPHRFYRTISP